MRTFLTLLGREVKSYFYSPIAYVVMCFFLIATGVNFYFGVAMLNQASAEITVVEAAFNTVLFWFPFLFFFPLITMRTYADEFRMGTFEPMTTAPVRDWQVILSKFLGAFIFYVILWSLTFLHFPLFEKITGKEAAVAIGAFGGTSVLMLLVGAFYISLGCLASSFSTEQINAAVICFVLVFTAFVSGLLSFILNISNPVFTNIVSYVSTVQHMVDFSRGLIDSRPIIFYLSMTILVLIVNFQVFQYRKWKA